MDLGFADATAVIAGGSRGIGLATALCLAEQGARVGVVGRNGNVTAMSVQHQSPGLVGYTAASRARYSA